MTHDEMTNAELAHRLREAVRKARAPKFCLVVAKRLEEAEAENERDGSFLDSFGACKVCDGEAPDGHTEDCDILKVERRAATAQAANDLLGEERDAWRSRSDHWKDAALNRAGELAAAHAENERLRKDAERDKQ